jgi:hypothetical protein
MRLMKHCRDCDQIKWVAEFHIRRASPGGFSAKCKKCQRAYDAARLHQPSRVALRLSYRTTPNGKERLAIGAKAWASRNPERRAAQVKVGNAIRNGKLIKSPCEVCGSLSTDAHHDDYSKPLDVRWLCKVHHAQHHRMLRKISQEGSYA